MRLAQCASGAVRAAATASRRYGVTSGGCGGRGRRPEARAFAWSSTGRGLGPRGRDHTYGGRRPCRTVCVGSGWTFTLTRAPVAVLDDVTGEVVTRRVNGRPSSEVLDVLRELPRPIGGRCMRRARPATAWCGGRGRSDSRFWRSARRETSSAGRVIGPRTDKRDAIRLARGCSRRAICDWCGCPAKNTSSCVNSARCREDLRADLMRARHRLSDVPVAPRARTSPGRAGGGSSSTATGSPSSSSTTRREHPRPDAFETSR